MNITSIESQPIACDLTAISAADREQHIPTATQIFQTAQVVQELPNGYAFRLPNEMFMFMVLARFVENERRCCPFFRFVLEIEPNGGPLWLQLTGGEGVKEFLQMLLNDLRKETER